MTLRGLALPVDLAPIVAGASRRPGPPDEVRDRLRRQLDWAFIAAAESKVVYAPGHHPLHAVATEGRRSFRPDRLALTVARAAAGLVLGHIPLALAGLGAAVAAVPITQLLLSHIESVPRSPQPTTQVAPRVTHRPVPAPNAPRTPTPSILVVPSLAPIPPPFESAQPASAPIPSADQPVATRPLVPAPGTPSGDDVALSVERELLDQARRALVRGDPVGALASLNEHGIRYPGSQLAEEREALTIQAMLRAGRVGDARFRVEAFRRRFPSSLFLPALDAALHE